MRTPWPKQEGGIKRGDGGGPARTRRVARGGPMVPESSSLEETGSRARRRRRRRRAEATLGAPTGRNGTTAEWRRPWKGCPGLGGAGATGTTQGHRRRARAQGRLPAACPTVLRSSTRLWSVWEWWMMLEEAGVALFIAEHRRGFGTHQWTPGHGARR